MSYYIKDYTTKSHHIFGDKKIGKPCYPLFCGTELEFECVKSSDLLSEQTRMQYRENIGKTIQPFIKDFAFTKHDGSMELGIEICSLPMSLEAHQSHWDNFFEKAKYLNLEVKSTCGMHVHISRNILTSFQIAKIMVFLYSKKNSKFIRYIAGRVPPKKYAEIGEKKVGDVLRHKLRKSALNLTNQETIEFRLFKSTLDKDIALKNIEFCESLVRFTWPASIGYAELTRNGVELFCNYIRKYKNLYPNLTNYLGRKGYIKF